jgi:hypothetical protein
MAYLDSESVPARRFTADFGTAERRIFDAEDAEEKKERTQRTAEKLDYGARRPVF